MAETFGCASDGFDDLTTVTGAGTRDSGCAMEGYGEPSVRDCILSSTEAVSTRVRGVVGCDGTERGASANPSATGIRVVVYDGGGGEVWPFSGVLVT